MASNTSLERAERILGPLGFSDPIYPQLLARISIGLDDAALEERSSIVAWLRSVTDPGDTLNVDTIIGAIEHHDHHAGS